MNYFDPGNAIERYVKFRVIMIFSILLLNSCRERMQRIIIERESKQPIDSVIISLRDIRVNSYPFPVEYSNSNGQFIFTRSPKNPKQILYLYKKGYQALKYSFDDKAINDTIYMEKDK